MSPPRVDGAGEAEPHPAMIFWPSFKQMAQEAGARQVTDHEDKEEEHDACSSCSGSASDVDEFEFAPVSRDSDGAFDGADGLLFPVFHRGSTFLSQEELQGGADVGNPTPGNAHEQAESGADYCLWKPTPRSSEPEPHPPALEAAGKSRSTGGVPGRSGPSPPREELRSASDGAGRFRFLASPSRAATKPAGGRASPPNKDKKKKKSTETDLATVHRLFYSKQHPDGSAAAAGGGHARRSYLPYRKDLVGFFAGGTGRFLPF